MARGYPEVDNRNLARSAPHNGTRRSCDVGYYTLRKRLTSLVAELEPLGVDLIIIDHAIDTSTPSERVPFNVLGAIGEFEADLIRERARAGLDAARRRGKTPRPDLR